MIEPILYCGLKTVDVKDLLINKEKTIPDYKIKLHRDILKRKLENSRLPRENILLNSGEIQENGKDEQKT